jgi:hypothetical protein
MCDETVAKKQALAKTLFGYADRIALEERSPACTQNDAMVAHQTWALSDKTAPFAAICFARLMVLLDSGAELGTHTAMYAIASECNWNLIISL